MARSEEDSYTSSSDDGGRKRRHSSKKSSKKQKKKDKKKKRKRDDRHEDDDDDDNNNNDDRRHHHRHDKKNRKKSRRDYSSSSNSDSDGEGDSRRRDSSSRRRRKKEHKKEKKKKKEKKRQRRRHRDDNDEDDHSTSSTSPPVADDRNTVLANALLQLFTYHPPLASELPIMLIRLAGGTSFDLQQMTDTSAAVGLSQVFTALKPFGVEQNGTTWSWKSPSSSSAGGSSRNKDELLLIKVVRAMMDQVGITTDAINTYENNLKKPPPATSEPERKMAATNKNNNIEPNLDTSKIELVAQNILKSFGNSNGDNDDGNNERENDKNNANKLSKELAGLCNMILDGESIALDGLPDKKLQSRLETLFEECGLEKSEMEEEDDDDDDDDDDSDKDEGDKEDNTPSMGYALPDDNEGTARSMIAAVVNICRGGKVSSAKRPAVIRGPVLDGQGTCTSWGEEDANRVGDDSDSDEDDEGPAPYGAQKGPALPPEMVKARAKQRAKQLERVKSGMDATDVSDGNAREEWMLVPGKFDFLGEIKSGKTIRSRQFEAKSKASSGNDGGDEGPIDPRVQAEVDAIKRAHEESRGPSLMEVHRQKKSANKAAAAAEEKAGGEKGGSSSNKSWKWNRDKDLDSGRRVDKDALKMVLGGASSELKTKFHGGFG